MLQQRQKRIIKYLWPQDVWVKGKDIAKVLNVTDRTIRNDILQINSYFGEEIIKSLKGSGYKLLKNPKVDIEYSAVSGIESITNKERILYILKKCIIQVGGCDIFDLSEGLFVSESTIQGDILKIKKILRQLAIGYANISISRDKVVLECNNIERYGLLYEVGKYSFVNLTIDDMEKYFIGLDINIIYKSLIDAMEKFKYGSRYLLLTKVTLFIALIIEAQDSVIENDEAFSHKCKGIDVVNYIDSELNLRLCKNSINAIVNKIEVSRDMHIIENEIREQNGISHPNYQLCREEVRVNADKLGLEIQNNEKLFNDLVVHIIVSVERIKRGIKIHNPLRKNIRDSNPFAYWLSKSLIKNIEKKLKVVFDFNELSFIAAYLSAITIGEEVKLESIKDIKIFLIVSDSRANMNYISNIFRREFLNQNVTIHSICMLNDMHGEININECDLVVATSKEDGEFFTDKFMVIRKNFDYVEMAKIVDRVKEIKRNEVGAKLKRLLDLFDYKILSFEDGRKYNELDDIVLVSNSHIIYTFSKSKIEERKKNSISIINEDNKHGKRIRMVFSISKRYKDIQEFNWLISYLISLANSSIFVEGIKLAESEEEIKSLVSGIYLKKLKQT